MLVVEPDLYGRGPSLRVALKDVSRNDHACSPGIPDEEKAMCRRSEYDLYGRTSSKPARTNSKPARSLVEVLRDLFRPRRPQVTPAEVVPFRAGGATRIDQETNREGSRAA